MPHEIRKLVFSSEELIAAVIDYCLRSKIPVPSGYPDGIEVSDDVEKMVLVKYPTDDAAYPQDVILSRDQVGAALIKYCGAQKIPLPRAAQKVLQIQDGDIALMVNLKWGEASANKGEGGKGEGGKG